MAHGSVAVPYRWDQCTIPHGTGAGPTEEASLLLANRLKRHFEGTLKHPRMLGAGRHHLSSCVETHHSGKACERCERWERRSPIPADVCYRDRSGLRRPIESRIRQRRTWLT